MIWTVSTIQFSALQLSQPATHFFIFFNGGGEGGGGNGGGGGKNVPILKKRNTHSLFQLHKVTVISVCMYTMTEAL